MASDIPAEERLLVGIHARTMPHDTRAALWGLVVDLAATRGSNGYLIDATLEKRRSEAPPGLGELELRNAGAPIAVRDRWEAIKSCGPAVLVLNLYADNDWVAGISDWGDDISAYIEVASAAELRNHVEELGFRSAWTSIE